MPRRILITGASVAGNTVAWWLGRAGLDVTVVERMPAFRDGGQNIDVRGVGREVLRRMGLEQAALDRGTGEEGTAWVEEDGTVAAPALRLRSAVPRARPICDDGGRDRGRGGEGMSAFVIMLRDVMTDAEAFARYAAAAPKASAGHPLRPLAFYGAHEVLEGPPVDGVVILEFPDTAAARAWYDSPAYAAARANRLAGADYRVLIVEGVA